MRTRTILVVDDNEDTCAFVSVVLEEAGYEVQTAAEGAQALAMQDSNPAELLISDLFMPGQEGMETIWRFKQQFPQTRIIAMSAGGRAGKQDILAAAALLDVGATLRKPFSASQLLTVVHEVLQSSQGQFPPKGETASRT